MEVKGWNNLNLINYLIFKDGTNFKVGHFIVNGIIVFNINAEEDEKFVRLHDRVQATYASIPKKASWIHFGKIKYTYKKYYETTRKILIG